MIIERAIGTTPGAKIDSDTESVRDSVSFLHAGDSFALYERYRDGNGVKRSA